MIYDLFELEMIRFSNGKHTNWIKDAKYIMLINNYDSQICIFNAKIFSFAVYKHWSKMFKTFLYIQLHFEYFGLIIIGIISKLD